MSAEQEQQITLEEFKIYIKANDEFEQFLLILVKYCHNSDYDTTLSCAASTLNSTLTKQKFGVEDNKSFNNILTMVLSSCYDISKEKTILNMKNGFDSLDANVRAEYKQLAKANEASQP